MEIKYDSYGNEIYDKTNFTIKQVSDLCEGDIVVYQNSCCKITKISQLNKKPLKWIYFVNIFTDDIIESVLYDNQNVLIPKIKTLTSEFINMTNNNVYLFNEKINNIVEIPITMIDKDIINEIHKKIKMTTEINVTTIEFQQFIRMINAE